MVVDLQVRFEGRCTSQPTHQLTLVCGFFYVYLYGPLEAWGPLMFFELVPFFIPGLLVVVFFPPFFAMIPPMEIG